MITANDPVTGLLAGRRRMAYNTGEPTGVEAPLLAADGRRMAGGQEDLIADLALDLLQKGTA